MNLLVVSHTNMLYGQLNMMEGKKMKTLEEQTRAEVIASISKGIVELISDECRFHGNDPQTHTMIVAALVMTINDLDKAFPGTRLVVYEMLTREITR